jgi:predicted ATPase/class 3 adenylate cyclase
MPDLPRGTVAFLFTDIEGSTPLWERNREVMAASVGRHLVLLRSAIESHNGVLFKVVGDAVQAAFPTASDAADAAIAGQRALSAEPWPDELGPLRVRMALHAGEAGPDDRGDYLAPALNRLARLLAAGHGGQVLLTDTVCRLLDGQLPDGVTLRELGRHELRDLQEPEQVWQVVGPDLPDGFPPLRSFERRPTNLPTQPNSLVGREAELAELTAHITRPSVHLVTLTGPGGTGKTRLALQAAASVLEAFPDGVFLVDLAPVVDPALVVPTIAGVLGVRAASSQAVGESLATWLAPRRLLLVLDNLEHLLPAAKAIAALLAACPRLTVLATSREPLHVRTEREVPVAPLALPEEGITRAADLARIPAVALFVQRAEAANPRFSLTEANATDVAAICQRLDGLPLAIELAAARIKLLPPAALLVRLERRLPLLTGGPRDLPDRQRTLRDAIAWSHDLLSLEDQVLFRRLGVFAGGWTLDTTEAVANPDGELDVLGGLDSLLNKSLVRSGHPDELEPRFGMLETVREFALEQLGASGEEATVRDAHAAAYLQLAEQCHREIWGPRQIARLHQIEAELPNVRAALAWLLESNRASDALRMAGNLGGFWYMHSHFAEARRWVEAALAATDPEELSRARALWCLGFCAWAQGDPGRARELLRESERLAHTVGDADTEVMAAAVSGSVAKYGDDDAAAEVACLRAADVARAAGNLHWVANSIMNLAEVAYRRGDLALAEERARESLAIFRTLGSIFPRHYTLSTLGYVALDRGQTAAALTAFEEGLEVARALNEGRGIASLLAAHAAVAVVVEEHDRALRLLGAAEAVREKAGHTVLLHQFRHAQTVAAVRAVVGDTSFETGFAAGQALRLTEALAEARAVGREDRLRAA